MTFSGSQEDAFTILEGTLNEVTITDIGVVNVNDELDPKSRKINEIVGVAGIVLQNAGLMGISQTGLDYEGENAETFYGRIGEDIVVGIFGGVSLLKEGDYIKAVVQKRGPGYFVHAILRPSDELLWMPIEVNCGSKALRRSATIVTMYLYFGSLILIAIIALIHGGNENTLLKLISAFAIGGIFFGLFTYRVGTRKTMPLAERAEKIFTLLGFPDPSTLTLSRAKYKDFHDGRIKGMRKNYESVYYYQLALEARRAGKRIPLATPNFPVETDDNREEVHEIYDKYKNSLSMK